MFRPALRSGWLRGVLVALLLFAQHLALTHALTHAARQAGGYAQQASPHHVVQGTAGLSGGLPANQFSKSCAFDLVYSQVLGGVTATAADIPAATGTAGCLTRCAIARIVAEPPPFFAQGPPAFL